MVRDKESSSPDSSMMLSLIFAFVVVIGLQRISYFSGLLAPSNTLVTELRPTP